MLKKLLSKVKKQKHPESNQQDQQNLLNPNNPLNESPTESLVNLITNKDVYSERDLYVFKLSNLFPFITVIVYLIFLGLAGYNYYLDTQLRAQKEIQERWIGTIANYENELNTGRIVEEKIKIYKNILSNRTDFKVKLNTLVKTLPVNVIINRIDADNDGFRIQLTGDNVLLFARLILLYLGSDEITQISLNSAILDVDEDTYTVEFSGNFE